MATFNVVIVRGTQYRIRMEGPDGTWRWSGDLGKSAPRGRRLDQAVAQLASEIHTELVRAAESAAKVAQDWANLLNTETRR